MTQYEYKTVEKTYEQIEWRDITLNAHGKEGWELMSEDKKYFHFRRTLTDKLEK